MFLQVNKHLQGYQLNLKTYIKNLVGKIKIANLS